MVMGVFRSGEPARRIDPEIWKDIEQLVTGTLQEEKKKAECARNILGLDETWGDTVGQIIDELVLKYGVVMNISPEAQGKTSSARRPSLRLWSPG